MSALRKLASQTAIYGLSSIIGRMAVWGLTPIYTARMEQGEYGVFSDLYSFVTYFLVILTFGMETAFFRYSNDDKLNEKPYSQSLIFVTGFSLVFLLICTIGSQGFANLLGYPGRPGLIMMVVWIIFLDVVTSLPMAKLRYDERPIVFAAVSLFSIFINIVLNLFFILVWKKTSAEYVFLTNVIASGLKFLLLLAFSLPIAKRFEGMGKYGSKFAGIKLLPSEWTIDKKMMRSMSSFGFYIMLAGLLGMINQNSDVNFIKRIWGDIPADYRGDSLTGSKMVAIFSANKKLALFISLMTQAFRYAAEPFFFRHATETNSRIIFARVFHYFMLVSLATFLFISSFSYEFVSTRILGFQLIDDQYWKGLVIVPLMLMSFVLWGAYTNLSIWFKLTKQVRFGILFSGVGVVLLILFDLILIPTWGYMGATIATFISYLVMTVLVYYSGQKYYFIPYKIGRIAVHSVIAITAYLINAHVISPEYGDSTFGSGKFFAKLAVCLAAVGLSYFLERYYPLFWKDRVSETVS